MSEAFLVDVSIQQRWYIKTMFVCLFVFFVFFLFFVFLGGGVQSKIKKIIESLQHIKNNIPSIYSVINQIWPAQCNFIVIFSYSERWVHTLCWV